MTSNIKSLTILSEWHSNIDAKVKPLEELHKNRLECRGGCSQCCVDELSVFEGDWQTSVSLNSDSSPLVLNKSSDGERLYLRRYWYCEHYNSQNLEMRMDNTLEVNDDQLNMTLDALFGDTSKP